MKKYNCVEYIECSTPREFVETLRPSNPIWFKKEYNTQLWNPWIYRGHWDASWELIPRIWRKEVLKIYEKLFEIFKNNTKWNQWNQIEEPKLTYEVPRAIENLGEPIERAKEKHGVDHINRCWALLALEFQLVKDFVELSERIGYEIDTTSHFLKGGTGIINNKLNALDFFQYSEDDPVPLYKPDYSTALAQHHGIPTRLLDWTRNPMKAAFFATNFEFRNQNSPDKFCVWAFDSSNDLRMQSNATSQTILHKLLVLPRSKIEFIKAQEGLFTWTYMADEFNLIFNKWPTLIDEFEHLYNGYNKYFKHISLPRKYANEVLKILWKENVTKVHLMPTYDNTVSSLKDRYNFIEDTQDINSLNF